MRLFLSSYRLGDDPGRLTALLRTGRPAAIIANATDELPTAARAGCVLSEVRSLAGLGLAAEEVDLRAYFGAPERLAADLERFELIWVRGGNTFVLRAALALSGADDVLTGLLGRDVAVWGGYSAGACVLAPSLRGLDLLDDPGAVRGCYGTDPLWEGLGLIDHAIVPHFDSEYLGGPKVERLANRYRHEGIPHRALRDGEVIVITS